MEIFHSIEPTETKLFIEVKFDFDFVARTYVMKEKEGTWEKTIIKDSLPGEGTIKFTILDKTLVFKDLNRIVVKTYLDLQQIDNVDKFMDKFKIKYNLLEDDDFATPFQNSVIYHSDNDKEAVFNTDKTKVMFTKVIKVA